MQEEIEHKTVNFAISTAKLSARTLLRGAQFFLRQYDKSASQGKQSMKRLIRQNRGVTNLEIEKTGIKDFDRCAKRYHIDYAIQKDLSCTPPRFLIFFKAQDADALNAAFKEYSAAVLNKAERPSVLAKLHDLAQVIYKDNADTIVGNMDSQIFLGGSEPTTLKELSEALGKETIDGFNTSDTRGNSPSYGTNYQKLGHDMPYLLVKSSAALNLT